MNKIQKSPPRQTIPKKYGCGSSPRQESPKRWRLFG